jgi:hypothetical protein
MHIGLSIPLDRLLTTPVQSDRLTVIGINTVFDIQETESDRLTVIES